ncbi:MAG: hypothetical protein AAF750_03945 [Planctomycetota bacterium]
MPTCDVLPRTLGPSFRALHRVTLPAWAAAALLWANPMAAQDAPIETEPQPEANEPAEIVPPLTPDVRGLLTDPLVFSGQVTGDPVWSVNRQRGVNSGGLELIQLPVAVGSVDGMPGVGEAGIKVSRSPVDVRGGRFVAWRLVEPEPEGPNADRVRREQARQASRQDTGTSSYSVGAARRNKAFLLDDLDERERRHTAGQSTNAADPSAEPQAYLADLPEGAPQLMRQFTLKPGGRLAYDLERRVPGMEFAGGDSLYLILLDREKAEQLKPVRPDRPTRQANASREQRQQADARYREELAKFRAESLAHRDLMRQVLDLPEEFEVDAPPRIYMVMERQTRIDTLQFTGPSPLPWQLPVADLQALRVLAGARSSGRSLGNATDADTAKQALRRIAQQNHPFSRELAAYTLLEGDLLSEARSGDLVENAALDLVRSGDATAQRIVALAATRVLPPNSVSAQVLTAAATGELAGLGLASLQARLAVDAEGSEPDPVAMVRTASAAAIDPNGPNPRDVMIALFQTIAPATPTRRSASNPAPLSDDPALLEASTVFAFDAVPEDRRAGVAEGIVAAAPHAPLAAYWLDQTLLKSDEPSWFAGTLRTLADTRVVVEDPRAVGDTEDPAPPKAADNAKVILDAPILLTNREHGLLRALRSSDQATRELAWAALGPFEISTGQSRSAPRGGSAAQDPGLSLFMTIVADAIELEPTPPAVVAFAANQDGAEGTDALVSLMLYADDEASRSAALALVGSERNIAPKIQDLAPAVRHRFADQMVTVVASPPADADLPDTASLTPDQAEQVKRVTGLMRQEARGRSTSSGFGVGWFCTEVAAGRVPTLQRWVDQATHQQDPRRATGVPGPVHSTSLIPLTTTPDIVLTEAALTALTLAAGGDLSTAQRVNAEALALPERSDSVMAEFWQATLAALIESRLADAAGPYRFMVRLEPPDANAAQPNRATPPTGNPLAGGRTLAQRLTERAAQQNQPQPQPEEAQPDNAPEPTTEIDLGILPLSITVTGQPSLGVDGLKLSGPESYLAIRLNDVSTLKSFGRPEVNQLPIEFRDDAIDLVPVEDDKWRGSLTLDDGERLILELVPEAE